MPETAARKSWWKRGPLVPWWAWLFLAVLVWQGLSNLGVGS
jgi:hypothetical protein